MKTDKNKETLIEQLKKTPIIEIACEKAGISRATYYRWRKENPDFAKTADEAIIDGESFINDMSESQVISLIKEKNWPAISFWLKYHHPKYANKIEVEANIKQLDEKLTPEQETVVREALRLASLLPEEESQEDNKPNENHDTNELSTTSQEVQLQSPAVGPSGTDDKRS